MFPRQKEVVSAFLIKTRLPSEIPRRMRHLKEISLWKATELRTFLHYISVVVHKNFMQIKAYSHYLLYFCGITILSTMEYKHLFPLAKKMLDKFVKDFSKYYGLSHLASNIHNLEHVAEDVERLGPLDSYSAYEFENNMRFIKPCVRSGTKIVEQVADVDIGSRRIELPPTCIKCKLVPVFLPSRPLSQLSVQRSSQPNSL
ncbi:uncharacterized protein LOC128718272 [Anopheles marshallii]|uniref:uncharacterized protein LOC128718272 n=1 Tax=Anopheles marshallii TaxID=1521116 RepID=UPI00237A9BE2|nr:uncharacterized protein LOC128718272 [Anopheles marshallii]